MKKEVREKGDLKELERGEETMKRESVFVFQVISLSSLERV